VGGQGKKRQTENHRAVLLEGGGGLKWVPGIKTKRHPRGQKKRHRRSKKGPTAFFEIIREGVAAKE